MKLQALIFDVDGTLADTEEAHRQAFNLAFAEAGLDWSWDRRLYGELLAVTGGKERIRHYVEKYGAQAPYAPEDGAFSGYVALLHQNKTRLYTGLLEAGDIPLRPGVYRLLKEAHDSGLKLAIATTTSPANIEALLRYSAPPEVAGWFDVIGDSEAAPIKKPAPDVYLYVLDRLELAPAACMAFEDSENGIRAAQKAGLKTIITVNEYTKNHDFTGAAIVLDHMGEPGEPFHVLSGNSVNGSDYLDLSLVTRLHGLAS